MEGKSLLRSKRILSLAERVAVIEKFNESLTISEISEIFDCGQSQIRNILRNQTEYLKEWNECKDPHNVKRIPCYKNQAIGIIVYHWALKCWEKDFPITESSIKNAASLAARLLDINDFIASKRWYERFQHKYNIVVNTDITEDVIELTGLAFNTIKVEDVIIDVRPSLPNQIQNKLESTFSMNEVANEIKSNNYLTLPSTSKLTVPSTSGITLSPTNKLISFNTNISPTTSCRQPVVNSSLKQYHGKRKHSNLINNINDPEILPKRSSTSSLCIDLDESEIDPNSLTESVIVDSFVIGEIDVNTKTQDSEIIISDSGDEERPFDELWFEPSQNLDYDSIAVGTIDNNETYIQEDNIHSDNQSKNEEYDFMKMERKEKCDPDPKDIYPLFDLDLDLDYYKEQQIKDENEEHEEFNNDDLTPENILPDPQPEVCSSSSEKLNESKSTDVLPTVKEEESTKVETTISNYENALKYLKPLEEFALLNSNFRAINFIDCLENLFKTKIREN